MNAKSLEVLGSIKSTLSGKKAAWVEDIKFSPDSTRVAFGSHGGNSKLNFVTVNAQGKPTKIEHSKVAISSALICLDWSQDSQVVVLNSQSYELLFIDANSKKMVSASSMKETQWQTWTCRFGFAV
jgi:WD40 repeat protein